MRRVLKGGWEVVSTTEYNQAPAWSVLAFPRDATVDTLDEFFGGVDGVDEMNFVLFSTSGISGSYTTIEEIEDSIRSPEPRDDDEDAAYEYLTVILVQPRIIGLRYGQLLVRDLADVERLKAYRAKSHAVIAQIGMPPGGE